MTASHFHLSDSLIQSPVNSTLLIAMAWIINHIYSVHTNSLTFSMWSSTAINESRQTELLNEILTSTRNTELTYVIENSDDVQCGDIVNEINDIIMDECVLRTDVILMVDSFEAFMHFKRQLVKRNFFIAGYYTIIYTGNNMNYYDSILWIFKELFNIYVVNVNIFVEQSQETLVYSYYPFTQYHCHAVTPVLHNRFTMDGGFVYDKPFFPRKNKYFYGCPVTVATWNSPPFIFFSKDLQGQLIIRGIEGALLRLLAVKMDFSIKLLKETSRGRVFPNLTASFGAVKQVIEGKANVTINSFVYSKYQLKAMLASYSYTSYPVVVAVPRGPSMSSFQRLTRPFKYIIWSCLSSSVLAGIIIIFVIKFLRKKTISDFVFGSHISTPFTNLLNIFFGGPLTTMPRRNFARYILLIWVMYTMVLRNAYSGELFIMLQDSTSRPTLKSIEELVQKNFTLMCTENTVEILVSSIHARRMKVIKGLPFQYLAKLHDSNSKIGVVTLRPYLRLYNRLFRDQDPIRTLPSVLVTVPLTMYFRRNSYLANIVNDHLLAFNEVGMMKIWNRFYLPREDVMHAEVSGVPDVLSVKLLLGLFTVYLFLLAFCVLVFALEMWSTYSPICRSVVNFFNY